MKTIEQLELNNIVLVDRYLRDQLSVRDARNFERRLEIDNELRLDFKMVVESYKGDYDKLKSLKKGHINLNDFNPDMAFLRRKVNLGKKIVGYGLMAALFSILLVIVCSLAIVLIA